MSLGVRLLSDEDGRLSLSLSPIDSLVCWAGKLCGLGIRPGANCGVGLNGANACLGVSGDLLRIRGELDRGLDGGIAKGAFISDVCRSSFTLIGEVVTIGRLVDSSSGTVALTR